MIWSMKKREPKKAFNVSAFSRSFDYDFCGCCFFVYERRFLEHESLLSKVGFLSPKKDGWDAFSSSMQKKWREKRIRRFLTKAKRKAIRGAQAQTSFLPFFVLPQAIEADPSSIFFLFPRKSKVWYGKKGFWSNWLLFYFHNQGAKQFWFAPPIFKPKIKLIVFWIRESNLSLSHWNHPNGFNDETVSTIFGILDFGCRHPRTGIQTICFSRRRWLSSRWRGGCEGSRAFWSRSPKRRSVWGSRSSIRCKWPGSGNISTEFERPPLSTVSPRRIRPSTASDATPTTSAKSVRF